jgi:lipopolysaccharide transport system ATP-binding protein
MKNLAIKAENISKQYRLGEVGTGTISHDLNRFWSKLRGKEDPYLKIGESNDRSKKGASEYVWSLKDINFEIEQGDAVGIIGRNGAGKSTLLKLLSKVTKPTTGHFKVNGRIASLLEVGTGFNPEMTGRENIYLNGAILGMRRKEIDRKFDEIVDFSGVERYIDTPVKRYSSGMYVRLAFAVAAHLESEILIVDEVLAVGDAEFQKKCLGKMGDVSKGEGRTVLFVSHNMQAINNLCNEIVLLDNGLVSFIGKTELGIELYLKESKQNLLSSYNNDSLIENNNKAIIKSIKLKPQSNKLGFASDEPLQFLITIKSEITEPNSRIGLRIITGNGNPVGLIFTKQIIPLKKSSETVIEFTLRDLNLAKGIYFFDFSIGVGNETSSVTDYHIVERAISLEILKKSFNDDLMIATWNTLNWGNNNYTNYEIEIK